MNILDELTGGYFTKKQNQLYTTEYSKSNNYNMYIKFDDDQPLILFKDIEKGNPVTLIFDDNNNKFFEVSCPKTGKCLKIYVKDSNENPTFNPNDYPNRQNFNNGDLPNDENEDDEDDEEY